MKKLTGVFVNYEFKPEWLSDYEWEGLTVYDRSEGAFDMEGLPPMQAIKTENKGNVDYDKLGFLIEHYDNLPDVFIWGKSNLFKYISKEEFDKVKDNKTFTPLLTQNHRIYSDSVGAVNFYRDGMYYERNTSWYLSQHQAKFGSWREWADHFGMQAPDYIPFAPGGNYILTRETVHKYSRDFYKEMRDTMEYTQLPGEAQLSERSYYLIWR